jgi:hypothetical protein
MIKIEFERSKLPQDLSLKKVGHINPSYPFTSPIRRNLRPLVSIFAILQSINPRRERERERERDKGRRRKENLEVVFKGGNTLL